MKYLISVLFLFLSVTVGNTQNRPAQFNIPLRTGDLLFCSSTSGALSKAIDQATQTEKETHFDHIGIYEVFAADSIFTLNPMTFKNPQTGKFLTGWIDHYQKLGIPVPEGEPGCIS